MRVIDPLFCFSLDTDELTTEQHFYQKHIFPNKIENLSTINVKILEKIKIYFYFQKLTYFCRSWKNIKIGRKI